MTIKFLNVQGDDLIVVYADELPERESNPCGIIRKEPYEGKHVFTPMYNWSFGEEILTALLSKIKQLNGASDD